MKLEPVYLVAPKEEPRTMPSRRAFLMTGIAFAAGAAAGGACGYSLGAAGAGPSASAESDARDEPGPDLEPTGDAQLDELRRFAVHAPLDELFAKGQQFLAAQFIDYRTDPVLWIGVSRLSNEIVTNPARRVDQRLIAVVIQNIRVLEPPEELGLAERIPALMSRRDEEKGRK